MLGQGLALITFGSGFAYLNWRLGRSSSFVKSIQDARIEGGYRREQDRDVMAMGIRGATYVGVFMGILLVVVGVHTLLRG